MPEVRPIDGNRLAELFETAAERGAGVLATVYRDAAHFARTAQEIKLEVQHGEWHESWHTDTVCASICTNCGKATTQSRTIVGQELMTNVR